MRDPTENRTTRADHHQQRQQQHQHQQQQGQQRDGLDSTMESLSLDELHPWLPEYRQRRRTVVAAREKDPIACKNLLEYFNRNISNDPDDFKVTWRAKKLSQLISENWLFLTYCHRFEQLRPKNQNRLCCGPMTDLLAKYIDLELVALKSDWKDVAESTSLIKKIFTRLSVLFVTFENTPEVMLDVILKLQSTSSGDKLCSLVIDQLFKKILPMLPAKPDSDLNYVRYLLAFRIWRMIHCDPTKKKDIYARAKKSLPSTVSNSLQSLLMEILPDSSSPHAEAHLLRQTRFHLNRSFDLRAASVNFVKYLEQISKKDEEAMLKKRSKITKAKKGDQKGDDERDPRLKRKDNSIYSSLYKNNNLNTTASSANLNIVDNNIVINNNNNKNNNLDDKVKSAIVFKKKTKRLRKNEIVTLDISGDTIVEDKKLRVPRWLENVRKILVPTQPVADVATTPRTSPVVVDRTTSNHHHRHESIPLLEDMMSRRSDIQSAVEDSIAEILKSSSTTPPPPPSPPTPLPGGSSVESKINRPEPSEDKNKARGQIKVINFGSSSSSVRTSPVKDTVEASLNSLCNGASKVDKSEKDKSGRRVKDSSNKYETPVLKHVNPENRSNKINVRSVGLKNAEEELKVSALREANKKTADSSNKLSSVNVLDEVSRTEPSLPNGAAHGNCSVIRRSSSSVAEKTSVVNIVEPKMILKVKPVNSILMKTDHRSEPQVQQALIEDKKNLISILQESHNYDNDNKLVVKEDNKVYVNMKRIKPESAELDSDVKAAKRIKECHADVNSSPQFRIPHNPPPILSNRVISQEPKFDALELLANVSAEVPPLQGELKIKPELSPSPKNLKDDENDLLRTLAEIHSEEIPDEYGGGGIQQGKFPTEILSNLLLKQQQDGSSGPVPVLFDDMVSKSMNYILDGETVILQPKGRNLYTINKTEASTKEIASKLVSEDKCFGSRFAVKCELTEAGLRGKSIKHEPDNQDIKFDPRILGDEQTLKAQTQGVDVYHPYTVQGPIYTTGPGLYPAAYNHWDYHHPYYYPATAHYPANHATQPVVPANTTVQEMSYPNSKVMTYQCHEYSDVFYTPEKDLSAGKQHQQQQQVVDKPQEKPQPKQQSPSEPKQPDLTEAKLLYARVKENFIKKQQSMPLESKKVDLDSSRESSKSSKSSLEDSFETKGKNTSINSKESVKMQNVVQAKELVTVNKTIEPVAVVNKESFIKLHPKKKYLRLMQESETSPKPTDFSPSTSSPVNTPAQKKAGKGRKSVDSKKTDNGINGSPESPHIADPIPSPPSTKTKRSSRSSGAKQTRAAVKRASPVALPQESDPEWSPSVKRKKRRGAF